MVPPSNKVTLCHRENTGQGLLTRAKAQTKSITAYWFAPQGLFSLLCYITQDHQPIVGWDFLHQFFIRKIAPQACLQVSSVGPYLNWGAFLSKDFSLYQVDRKKKTKLTRTITFFFYKFLKNIQSIARYWKGYGGKECTLRRQSTLFKYVSAWFWIPPLTLNTGKGHRVIQSVCLWKNIRRV